MGISTTANGTPDEVQEQLKQYGEQFASDDGASHATKASRRQTAAASASLKELTDGSPDGTKVNASISGSESEGGGGYLNISYSVSTPAHELGAAGSGTGAAQGSDKA